MIYLVKHADTDAGRRFIAATEEAIVSTHRDVAFDCEGVNLSRIGSLELISICFSSMDVFLVDVAKPNRDPTILKALKDLFESTKVKKIIHDCKMDSDALFHILGIKITNVHDTSCYHQAITRHEESKNLNHVLSYNIIGTNTVRNTSVYKTNPSFWATRPITKTMIEWASSDVDKLFDLASNQLKGINPMTENTAKNQTLSWVSVRDMKVATGLTANQVGLFIGRGGSNIRRVEKQTNTHIYTGYNRDWFVYYLDEKSLDSVKRSMRN
jgi:ribonuclease D